MNELKSFVKQLNRFGFEIVSIREVFEEDSELLTIKDLLRKIKDLGIDEVIAEYYESFEFVTSNGKYIEICGVC